MPLQRRLAKRGFNSLNRNLTARVRLSELNKIDSEVIDLSALKAAGVIPVQAQNVKIYLHGKLDKVVTIKGLTLSEGASNAVSAAGGKVEE